jgi:hypothetical protein
MILLDLFVEIENFATFEVTISSEEYMILWNIFSFVQCTFYGLKNDIIKGPKETAKKKKNKGGEKEKWKR